MSPPLRPDAPTARRWLSDELAETRYTRRDLMDRLREWFESFFDPGTSSPVPANLIFAVLIGALLVVLLVVLIRRFPRRLAPRAAAQQQETAVGPLDEPDRHRRAAAAFRAAGDHAAAVVESYRALVSASAERELLRPVPGLTAQRAARELAARFPSLQQQLTRAADCFDLARYARVRVGGAVISAADAEFVAALEQQVAATPAGRRSATARGVG